MEVTSKAVEPPASIFNWPNFCRISIILFSIAIGFIFYRFSDNGSEHYEKIVLSGKSIEDLGFENISAVLNEINIARSAVKAAMDSISIDWDIENYPLFFKTMHIPKTSYDIQVHKFRRLILEHNASLPSLLLKDARDKKSKKSPANEFIVGFSGSSITAGHDNYFNESYPMVFKSIMAPVLKSFGEFQYSYITSFD